MTEAAKTETKKPKRKYADRYSELALWDALKAMKGEISAEDAAAKRIPIGGSKKVLSRPQRLRLEAFTKRSKESAEVKKQIRTVLKAMRGKRGAKAMSKTELIAATKAKPVKLKLLPKGAVLVGKVANWLNGAKSASVLVTYYSNRIEIRAKE